MCIVVVKNYSVSVIGNYVRMIDDKSSLVLIFIYLILCQYLQMTSWCPPHTIHAIPRYKSQLNKWLLSKCISWISTIIALIVYRPLLFHRVSIIDPQWPSSLVVGLQWSFSHRKSTTVGHSFTYVLDKASWSGSGLVKSDLISSVSFICKGQTARHSLLPTKVSITICGFFRISIFNKNGEGSTSDQVRRTRGTLIIRF